jgi:spore germination cell wall hydrolase CwlJ-like protein
MFDAPQAEIQCLAQTIHGEAQGESTIGKEAVAQVIINRTKSKAFPKTVCGVVKQRHQFEGYRPNIKPSQEAYRIARKIFSLSRKTKFLYFNTIGPKKATRIGRHLFW